jgi:transcriptional regulator with XRE-family HTH domain
MGAEGRQLSGKPGGDEAPGPVALGFGEQVRSVQRDRGLTVRAFAEQLGISHGFLCDVQAGKAKPSPSLVARIDEIGELGGALVRAYPELLAEHEARKRARAERRRQLLGQVQGPTSGRSNQSPESSRKAANPQKPRYSGGTLALEPHAQATPREDDANRREAINRTLSGRRAWSSRSTEPPWRGTLAQRTGAGPTGKQDLQPVEQLPQAQADAAGFGWRSRSRVRKPCAAETRVTWWCQPAQERPSKWSSPSAPLHSR